MLAALVVTFAGGVALAQETCESKAVSKDGKPLADLIHEEMHGRSMRFPLSSLTSANSCP